MALPLAGSNGADIGASKSLSHPRMLALTCGGGMVRSFPDSIFGQGRSTRGTPGLFKSPNLLVEPDRPRGVSSTIPRSFM